MVESLWLKKQNLKEQQELEQKAFDDAIRFQKILDNREFAKKEKERAAEEFKQKVYERIESYIKAKKAMDEERENHFMELGDAK